MRRPYSGARGSATAASMTEKEDPARKSLTAPSWPSQACCSSESMPGTLRWRYGSSSRTSGTPWRPQRSTAYSNASLQPENRVRANRESSNVRASSRVNNRSASGAVLSGHAKNRSGLPAPNCLKSAVLPSLRRP